MWGGLEHSTCARLRLAAFCSLGPIPAATPLASARALPLPPSSSSGGRRRSMRRRGGDGITASGSSEDTGTFRGRYGGIGLVDADANLLHPLLRDDLEEHVLLARQAGVAQFFVPGSTLKDSEEGLTLSRKYPSEIYASAGIHPYHAPPPDASGGSGLDATKLAELASQPSSVCVGECGLDFSDGFPPPENQLPCFEMQVSLACSLQKPLFLHERLAHEPFCEIMDKFEGRLPPCLVHCFTGTAKELEEYMRRGYYLGVTGFLLKPHGEYLRNLISSIPLNRLVVETDAPYLGFKGCRSAYPKDQKKQSPNVPSALPLIVEAVAESMGLSPEDVARGTASTARMFFGMEDRE